MLSTYAQERLDVRLTIPVARAGGLRPFVAFDWLEKDNSNLTLLETLSE